jgi:hypothetical protein
MFSLAGLVTPIVVIFLILIVANAAFRVLRQYERGVMFTLGRFSNVRGPGLVVFVPFIQQLVRVDLRTVVMEVPGQDLITRDNVSVKVDAVLYFHVVDPEKAIIQVEQYVAATNMLAQTTLRSVLGQHELDGLLSKRTMLNTDVQDILDARTKEWGIIVTAVEIRDVQLTNNMVKAIAKQARPQSESHPCRCRIPSLADARECRDNTRIRPGRYAIMLLADAHGDRRRTQLHHRLPDAARYRQAVPGYRRSQRRRFAGTQRAQNPSALMLAGWQGAPARCSSRP